MNGAAAPSLQQARLQQIQRMVLEGPRLPTERLDAAAAHAAEAVAAGHLAAVAAHTLLMVAGQASGLGQRDAAANLASYLGPTGRLTSQGRDDS